jgi:GTP-binding protein
MNLPTLAIVGRPNVGKSTLFNRLVGRKLALVDDRPGVTRDRREGEASLLGLDFTVIDTAGYEDEDPHSLPGRMRAQTLAAVTGADAALFLIDARAGVTPLDEEIARWLREQDTPVILAANKAEGRAGESGILELIRWASASRSRSARSMARAWSTCSSNCCRTWSARKPRRRRRG